MVALIDEPQLRGQFVHLPRHIVTGGDWRTVWLADGGAAGSACPVMALLSWGYRDRGARSSLIRLSRLSGVPTSALQQAKRILGRYELITPLRSSRRGVWAFRLGHALQDAELLPSFRFPGALVADGFWANSTPHARAVLIVLAALARAAVIEDEIDALPGHVQDWLYEHRAIEEDFPLISGDSEWEGRGVRRVGETTLEELSFLSGIGTDAVREGLGKLGSGLGPVIVLDETMPRWPEEVMWYHLPAYWWAPPGVGHALDMLRDIRLGTDADES